MFTWKSYAGLKFHFGQFDRYEIHTVLSFISPQFMWTQVKSWLNPEVRFSTEMKSHTVLSSFHLSSQRTVRQLYKSSWLHLPISTCNWNENSTEYLTECWHSSSLEVLLGKLVLKTCGKFTREHPEEWFHAGDWFQ